MLLLIMALTKGEMDALSKIVDLNISKGTIEYVLDAKGEWKGEAKILAKGCDKVGVWWQVFCLWKDGIPVSIIKSGREPEI
jgi:hypothetical protein